MNNRSIRLVFIAFTFLFSTSAAYASEINYRLSSGDVISITVFAEPDLSFKEIKLTENGGFTYPFIGEIKAKGLTAVELEKTITSKLKGDYLINPKVTVSVLEYRQFYITGEVNEPDGYPYQPGLTVRRAIALAGGLTERASERRMTIVREADPDKTPQYVDMEDIIMPGDTLTIDQGFF